MGCCNNYESNEKREYYDKDYPAVDADGYVENWWKLAVDDMEACE